MRKGDILSRLNKTYEILDLAMLMLTHRYGLTIEDIQNHFECSRRSAERMKSLLSEIFPDSIQKVPTTDKKQRWRFVKGSNDPLITFSKEDFVNLELIKPLINDDLKAGWFDKFCLKIKALTPHKNLSSLDTDISAILESEGYAVRQYSRNKCSKKALETIRTALLSFKKLRFDYKMGEETISIILNPYGIIIADKYFLVGFNEYVNDIRLYLLNAISNIEILQEYFEKDDEFSLKNYCSNSFGIYQEKPLEVVLEFDKCVFDDIANYHFHPTQITEKLQNGNALVKFKSGGTHEICNELFKWGEYVKIIAPQSLKDIYKVKLENLLKKTERN